MFITRENEVSNMESAVNFINTMEKNIICMFSKLYKLRKQEKKTMSTSCNKCFQLLQLWQKIVTKTCGRNSGHKGTLIQLNWF